MAGILLWANFQQRSAWDYWEDWDYGLRIFYTPSIDLPAPTVRGWPATAYYDIDPKDLNRGGFSLEGVAFNAIVAIVILVTFGGFTEFLVRKFRKAKRHDG